jgi:hypothetical protein
MAEDAETLLFDSLAVIDDELARGPTADRKKVLDKARQEVNDQLDDLQARQLTTAAAAVKRAADALEKVVASGSTDPIANVLKSLKKFLKPDKAIGNA